MSSRHLGVAATLALLAAASASAQAPLATPTSGLTFGLGVFGYGQDRITNDLELRITATAGWRTLTSGFYVEPYVQLMGADEAWHGDACSEETCPGGRGVTQAMPKVWPGIGVGVTLDVDGVLHSLGTAVSVGVGDRLQPMLGLRYETAVRYSTLYVELSMDRTEWADRYFDPVREVAYLETERRWMGGLSVGVRLWLRRVSTPAPKPTVTPDLRAEDAGIIPPDPVPAKPDPVDDPGG